MKRLWKRGLQRTQPIRSAILAAVAAVVASERLIRRKPDYGPEEDVLSLGQMFPRREQHASSHSPTREFRGDHHLRLDPGLSGSAIYKQPLPGQTLMSLQEDQGKGNDCGPCSIAQALSLMTGTRYTCDDIDSWAAEGTSLFYYNRRRYGPHPKVENSRPVDLYRMPFGATAPSQTTLIINDFAEQHNLDITAELHHMNEDELRRIIRNPDQIAIVTIAYNKDIQPTLWRENNLSKKIAAVGIFKDIEHPNFGAHSMVLAAYDPDMIIKPDDEQIIQPLWGFINSWEAPGTKPEDPQSLYWMTAADFTATWGYEMPFDIGSNNVVVVSR